MKQNSRHGKLKETLEVNYFDKKLSKQDIENIIILFNNFEKDNLVSIEKLKRERKVEINRINGALKQTINAHGPITKLLIGSATKRIWGSLLEKPKKQSLLNKIISWIKEL